MQIPYLKKFGKFGNFGKFGKFFSNLKNLKSFYFSPKIFFAKNLTLKNSLKCTLGLIVNIFIYRLAECTVHSCHVHIMLDSLSGGSLEPAVTSLETLQACCNFLWNNSGMSIIIVIFSFHFIGTVPAFCSQASSCNFVMPIFYKLVCYLNDIKQLSNGYNKAIVTLICSCCPSAVTLFIWILINMIVNSFNYDIQMMVFILVFRF